LLRRCLAKEVRYRLSDIADVRLELDDAMSATPAGTTSRVETAARTPWLRARPWIAGLVLGSIVASSATWLLLRPQSAAAPGVQRFGLALPPGMQVNPSTVAVAPDGRDIVFPASDGKTRMLYARAIDALDVRSIAGTENALNPFFSPEGNWVGFFSVAGRDSALKKVAIHGGAVTRIADAPIPPGGSWGDDGTIVFATNPPDGVGTRLLRVPSAGGPATVLLEPDEKQRESAYAWPEILPGSRALLFSIASNRTSSIDRWRIAALSLDTGAYHVVIERGLAARYLPSGHVVYLSGSDLMAVPFDTRRLAVTGAPVSIAQGIRASQTGSAEPLFGVSRAGLLVYGPSTSVAPSRRSLVWVDRQGREEPVPAPARAYHNPRLSPDGSQAAFDLREDENDVWTWHFGRRILSRITVDPASDQGPVWMPDGRRLVFSSDRNGAPNLYLQSADGSGEAQRVTDGQVPQAVEALTPDGRQIVFRQSSPRAALTAGGWRTDQLNRDRSKSTFARFPTWKPGAGRYPPTAARDPAGRPREGSSFTSAEAVAPLE
jgi:serine/threonine-protein kinase